MAETRFATGDALTQKKWASSLGYAIVYATELSPLIGTDENSIIHMKTELSKGKGDNVTFPLMKKLTGAGFTENEIAEGNGESLSLYSDSVTINELGHVVDIPNDGRAIDSQRVAVPLRQAASRGLKNWKAERMSRVFFGHACGYTPENTNGAKYNGNNTITEATTNRILRVNARSTDAGLVAGDEFTLEYVDYARELAETGGSNAAIPINPINVRGNKKSGGQDIEGGKYCMYLHPYQVTDLRTSTSTGQWLDIQKSAMNGGKISKNPIFSDAIGEYNNVILKKANQVTQGHSSGTADTDVRRAVLLGAQAVALGYSRNSGPTTYMWNEELIDHKRRLEVSMMCMYGMTKCVFDSEDFGTIVVSSYAVNHDGS